MIHWLVSNTVSPVWHNVRGSSQSELSTDRTDQWGTRCGDNKYVYSPGDDADWDNNDMINERDINICDNDQTRDGVMAGLMNTFNKDNDLAPSSLWLVYWGKCQLILTNVCQANPTEEEGLTDCVVFLLWTLFWTCLNNIWEGIRVGVMMKGTNVWPVWVADPVIFTLCPSVITVTPLTLIYLYLLWPDRDYRLTPTSGQTMEIWRSHGAGVLIRWRPHLENFLATQGEWADFRDWLGWSSREGVGFGATNSCPFSS